MTRTWKGRGHSAVLGLGLLLCAVSTAAPGDDSRFQPVLPDSMLWPQGRYVYQRNCLVCHGKYGDGRGEMGRELKPRPRNFSLGIFKYRSTPAGMLPADADLERTIRTGLAGTAMPVFKNLSDREIRSVIEYLKSFSPRWTDSNSYAPVIRLPSLPAWIDDAATANARAEKGRLLFKAACATCHGTDGSGQPAAAKELEDSWGQPATPADLRRGTLRSGRNLDAVYRVLLTGIDGTPMPSFAGATTEEERWDLVAFIAQLRRNHAAAK